MKQKVIILKTVKEMLAVLNENNIDNFLVDFKCWLELGIEFKSNMVGIVKFDDSQFKWIDDGEHNLTVNVTIKDDEKTNS